MKNIKKKLKKYKYNLLEIFIIIGSIFILSCFIWDNRNIIPDAWNDITSDFGSVINEDSMLDKNLVDEGISQLQTFSNLSEENLKENNFE